MKSESLFKTCPKCNKGVPAKAKICPECGHKLKKLSIVHWIGIILASVILISIISASNDESKKSTATAKSNSTTTDTKVLMIKPPEQLKLEAVLTDYAGMYKQAKNELQKSLLRTKRKAAISAAINSFEVKDWAGTLSLLETNSDGKGIIEIKLSRNASVGTWNNALSDMLNHTMIEQNSELFEQLLNLSTGTKVYFSGEFFQGEDDYLEESSITEEGSMRRPELIMKFSKVEPIN